MSTRVIIFALCVIGLISACKNKSETAARELHVAAAADLIPAFEEIGHEFEATHKIKVVFSFGSTGLLSRQIENGAPMDVFAAASVDYIDQLEQKGLILSDTKAVYARGRIALWTAKESTLKIEKITDLSANEVKRIA